MKTLADYTPEQLEEAISLKKQIAALEARLANLSTDRSLTPRVHKNARIVAPVAKVPKKRKISPEGRAKIAAAAKARWAKAKAKGKNSL